MPDEKNKFRSLLAAAESALAEGAARAAHFESADDFKRSLIKGLNSHAEFEAATRTLHLDSKSRKLPAVRNQVARKAATAGRVQASRLDTNRGHSSRRKQR